MADYFLLEQNGFLLDEELENILLESSLPTQLNNAKFGFSPGGLSVTERTIF